MSIIHEIKVDEKRKGIERPGWKKIYTGLFLIEKITQNNIETINYR